jgi:hypothetical protein
MATLHTRILIVLDGGDQMGAPDRELALGVASAYAELRRRGAETIFACDGGGFPLIAGHMRVFSDDAVIAGFLADHIALDDFVGVVFFPIDATDLGAASALRQAFLDQGKTVVLPIGSPRSGSIHEFTMTRSSATDLEWIKHLLR